MGTHNTRLQRKNQPERDLALSAQPADRDMLPRPAADALPPHSFSLDQIDVGHADPAAGEEAARVAQLAAQRPELLAGPSEQAAAPSGYDAAPFILQAALRVNEPGDQYEQEAERVATQVMRMPAIGTDDGRGAPMPLLNGPSIQRSAAGAGVAVTPEIEEQVARLQSGGAPLAEDDRDFFERRLGLALDHVRIRDDAEASDTAQALNARAFTVGHSIMFGQGEYRPGTPAGRELLAHELTHVVQQTGAVPLSADSADAAKDMGEDVTAPDTDEAIAAPEPPKAQAQPMEAVELPTPEPTPAITEPSLDPAQEQATAEEGSEETAQASQPGMRRGYELDPVTTLSIARMQAAPEPEGVCPVCGKRGTGTCPDCGQPFVPIQRFPAGNLPLVAQASPGAPGVQRFSFGDVFNAGKDLVGDALSMGADGFMAIIERIAPQLAELIRAGPIGLLTDAIKDGVQGWLQSILGKIDLSGAVGSLEASLTDVFAAVSGMLAGDDSGCAALERTLDRLRGLGESITNNPVIQTIQSVIEQVQGAFEKISDLVLAPAFDALAGLAGGVFDEVKSLAGMIAGWGSQIRSFLGKAWDWVKEQLGLGGEGDGEGGIFAWLKDKASEAWATIQATLQPVIGPLKTAGIAALAFTPAGPIYLLVKYVPQLVESVQWLIKHREDPDMVKHDHDQMGNAILPGLLNTVKSFGDTLGQVAGTLADTAEALSNSVLDLLEAIGGVPLLNIAQGMVRAVSDGIQRFVGWAKGALTTAAQDVQALFGNVQKIVTPIIDVLVQIAPIILNPSAISVLLAGQAWQRLPDCYKAPIIDFLLDICIGFLEKLPDFTPFGPLWPIVKNGVLGFLQGLRSEPDEVKVEIADRLAKIIGGSSPEFLFGFVKGLLKGLWKGLTDPFVTAYELLKLLSAVLQWIEGGPPEQRADANAATAQASAGEAHDAEQPAEDTGDDADNGKLDLGALMQAAGSELGPAINTITDDFWPAVQEYFSGGEGVTFETVREKLGEAWAALEAGLQAAGATLAQELCAFFVRKDVSDADLGESVGELAGMLTFEVVVGILTAGTITALKPLQGFAKLLTWTDGAFEAAFKALRKIGGVLLDGLSALRKAISNAGGAVGRVLDALGEAGEKLIKLAGDLLSKAGSGGRKAGKAGDEIADEVAEKAAKAGDEIADEAVERADDALKPSKRSKADEATEAAELPMALAEARAITATNEALHTPVPGLLAELAPLKAQFSWINDFDAQPRTPTSYRIIMRQKEKEINPNYDTQTQNNDLTTESKITTESDIKSNTHTSDVTREHVHKGGTEVNPQSPYKGKWDGSGLHNWNSLQKRCNKDGFSIKEVKYDPKTGVRRVWIERVGTDPKTGKEIRGVIPKTIYPPKMTAEQIDAAGEEALHKALAGGSGTKLEPFGARKRKDGITPADGYFEAFVPDSNGTPIRIQGWFKEDSDGTKTISSHTPIFDDNWPDMPSEQW